MDSQQRVFAGYLVVLNVLVLVAAFAGGDWSGGIGGLVLFQLTFVCGISFVARVFHALARLSRRS